MNTKLAKAAALINEVSSQLDNSDQGKCICGRTHYSNWPEHQLYIELMGIYNKLWRIAPQIPDKK